MNTVDRISVKLSLEELALVLSLLGQPEAGSDLLKLQLGRQLDAKQIQERLVAASHSLIAQGFAAIDMAGTIHLLDDIALVGEVITKPDYSIRLMKTHKNADMILTYHVWNSRIFEHQIMQGVVHAITELHSADDALQKAVAFFGIEETTAADGEMRLPLEVLGNINAGDMEKVSTLLDKLGETEISDMFYQDVGSPIYKGSLLRIDYESDNTPVSNQGVLLLRGMHNCWIMMPSQDTMHPWVDIATCTTDRFTSHMQAMFSE